MGLLLSSAYSSSSLSDLSYSSALESSPKMTIESKLPILQTLIGKIDDVKEKLNDNEYKQIVETVALISKDQYKLIDVNKQFIITNNKLSLYDNKLQTVIDFISESNDNWRMLDFIKRDFTKREYGNFTYQLLQKITKQYIFVETILPPEDEFIRKYKSAVTFENVKFTQKNSNGDTSNLCISNMMQDWNRYIAENQLIITNIGIASFIFHGDNLWEASHNNKIHKYWYSVAQLLLSIETCFRDLPYVMKNDFNIVSSINFVYDFEVVNERFKQDQELISKLFQRNVYFYKYFNDANKRKHMYDVLNPLLDIRCSEVIFLDESKITECIIHHLPKECFEDKLYIYRFISKFKTSLILIYCDKRLRADDTFLRSVFQLDFSKRKFLYHIDESLLEEDFIMSLVTSSDTPRSMIMKPLISKKKNIFTSKFLSEIRVFYPFDFKNSITKNEAQQMTSVSPTRINRRRSKRLRTGN